MRNALSAAIVTGTVNKTGAIDLFASRVLSECSLNQWLLKIRKGCGSFYLSCCNLFSFIS